MAEHFEGGAIGPAAKDHSLPVGLAHIADDVVEQIDDRLAVGIVNGVTRVPEIEIPAAIGAHGKSVHGVVVLRLAGLGEERLFPVGHEITVVVVKHPHIGCARHDHLPPRPVANHADAQRRIDIPPLIKYPARLGAAVAIGIFQHENPVAGRAMVFSAAIIHHFAHPHPPPRIDIDIGRAGEKRFGSEERRLQIIGNQQRPGAIAGCHRAARLRRLRQWLGGMPGWANQQCAENAQNARGDSCPLAERPEAFSPVGRGSLRAKPSRYFIPQIVWHHGSVIKLSSLPQGIPGSSPTTKPNDRPNSASQWRESHRLSSQTRAWRLSVR